MQGMRQIARSSDRVPTVSRRTDRKRGIALPAFPPPTRSAVMAGEMESNKDTLRRAMRAQRAALGAATLGLARSHLTACLGAFSPYLEAAVVVAYLAIGHEVPTDSLVADALRRGKRVYVPRVADRCFIRYEAAADVSPGSACVPEPDQGEALEPGERRGVVLVPLLAWTPDGDRLGRGGGWYDRVLPSLAMPTVGVGIRFSGAGARPNRTLGRATRLRRHREPHDRLRRPGSLGETTFIDGG